MPEMTFTVQWPDGAIERCYSPSLVMHDHLTEGASYPLGEFVARSTTALDLASVRVRERYGFECTSALAQRAAIELSASRQADDGTVVVLGMEPPLPGAGS